MRRSRLMFACIVALGVAGCMDDDVTPGAVDPSPLGVGAARTPARSNGGVQDAAEAALRDLAVDLMAEYGSADVALDGAFWMGDPDQQAMGGFVFFNDRGNKQLPFQWVPADPRRGGRTNIKYATVPSAPAGLTPAEVDAAVDRAMATWDGVACSSGLSVDKASLADPDVDIVHLGFAPLPPGVLAATFPFIWVDGNLNPTDIDNDGNLDYAFALILYSTEFAWAIDGNIDVETVTLHEAGHGLAQGHFGSAFVTLRNGRLHFSPRAVMNATYSGVQQSITRTDNGGHCSMWGAWPNN